MKKQIILFLSLISVMSLYAQPRYDSRIFSPDQPKGVQAVDIVYNADGKDLEFSDEVQVAIFAYDNFEWKRESLPMTKNSQNLWTVKLPLSSTTAFLGAKFYQGDLNEPDAYDNNNNKGYALVILDKNGMRLPGGYLAEANFQNPKITGGYLLSYYTQVPAVSDVSYLKDLAEKELTLSSKNYIKYFTPFMKLQELARGTEFPAYAQATVKKYLTNDNLSEENLAAIHRYTKFNLKDDALASSIEARILKIAPNGPSARFIAYTNSTNPNNTTPEQTAVAYENFLQKFPLDEWRKNKNNQEFIYYTVFRGLGSAYFDSKQFDKFIALYNDIDFRTGNELMRWNVMRAYVFNLVSKDSLYQVTKKIVPQLISRKSDGSYEGEFPLKSQADSNMNKQLDAALAIQIGLLNDLKKYEEARRYFFELSENGRYDNADLNEINLHVLEALNNKNEILSLLEMSVKHNTMTPRMFDKLKELYLQSHNGNADQYEAYLSSLRSNEEMEKMRQYVNHNWVNHPMPTFRLESAEGSYVTPEDWKGKIVVVDFWATWCKPCIMAFPGMQLLVDKYADDKQIAVYMVGTMQSGDYKGKSVGYVLQEGFRFNLLHDSVDPKTNEQNMVFRQLVPLFGDSSIPRKIIVKDGTIRYASGGYSGSPSKLMDELSLAIDILKNEK